MNSERVHILLPALSALFFIGTATATPATPVLRWNAEVHRAIATVAYSRLSPSTRVAIHEILGDTTLALASTWADQIRGKRPQTRRWHYVNISILDSTYLSSRDCQGGCIVAALENQLAILSDETSSQPEKSEALKWVVHLIADLHMPLHSSNRGDRGGNDLTISYQNRRTNLHTLWDGRLFEEAGLGEEDLVAQLESQIGNLTNPALIATGSIRDWVLESHDVARDVVYPNLPVSLILGTGYFQKVHAAAELQLVRASIRLAAVLEQANKAGSGKVKLDGL